MAMKKPKLEDPKRLLLRAIVSDDQRCLSDEHSHRVQFEIDGGSAEVIYRFDWLNGGDGKYPGHGYCTAYIESVTVDLPMTDDPQVGEWINGGTWYHICTIPSEAMAQHESLVSALDRAKAMIWVSAPNLMPWSVPHLQYENYRRGVRPGWMKYGLSGTLPVYGTYHVAYQLEILSGALDKAVLRQPKVLRGLLDLIELTRNLSGRSSKSDWVRICTCVEIGVKEWFAQRSLDVELILTEQGPPVHKLLGMLTELGYPVPETKKYVQKGLEVRNRLIHRWHAKPPEYRLLLFYSYVAQLTLFELQLHLDPQNQLLKEHVEKLQEIWQTDKDNGAQKRFVQRIKTMYDI